MPLEIQFIQASTHITVIQGSRIVNGHAPVPLSSDFWEWRMGSAFLTRLPCWSCCHRSLRTPAPASHRTPDCFGSVYLLRVPSLVPAPCPRRQCLTDGRGRGPHPLRLVVIDFPHFCLQVSGFPLGEPPISYF